MRRRLFVGTLLFFLLSSAAAVPAFGAAAGVDAPSVRPNTVETGTEATVSFSTSLREVDTSDGTTRGTTRFSLSGPVDLAAATVTAVTVRENATDASATIDESSDSVIVTWNDSDGVANEQLAVSVTLDAVVVTRTGTVDVVASADADATGGTDATSDTATLTAVTPDADRSLTERPARLYLGERDVDITGVGGTNPAGESQSFYGLGGAAAGRSAVAGDTRFVDVTAANRFAPGTYNFSSAEGAVDVSVVRPRVTDLTLFPGETAAGADVTNGSIPREVETVTLEAAYNFDEAENLTVVVEDERGADITEQLTGSPTVATSDGTVTLDVSDLDVGRYTVSVEGSDDLTDASRTVSLRVRDAEKSVTLSKTRVTRGDSTIATLAGAPGDVRYLRISGDALRSDRLLNPNTARDVFDRTSQVQSIGADSDANVLYAVIALDDDGISEARIRTAALESGSVDVELATDFDAAAAVEDDVTLTVEDRAVSVEAVPATTVGETITVSGTAPESERVKLYARVDERYRPLYENDEADGLAETTVDADGTWDVDVDTGAVVDQASAYRLVAVADPGPSRLGSSDSLDESTLRTLEPRGSTALTTVEGSLTLAASRTTIAATGTDEFTLSGVAAGRPDEVRWYHVGPRGDVSAATIDVGSDAGRYVETVDGIDRRGTHVYLVVAPGRDGSYAYAPDAGPSVASLLSGSETQSQALETLVDAYEGPGSDDHVARVAVVGTDADVSVSTPADGARIAPASQTLTGTATVEDGSTVFVDLRDDDGAVRVAEATVSGGTWNTTLDLRGVPEGTYQLSVETTGAETTRSLFVSTAPTTPQAATPTDADDAERTTASASETPSNAERGDEDVGTVTTGSPSTSTRLPGFGTAVAVVALALSSLLLAMRDW